MIPNDLLYLGVLFTAATMVYMASFQNLLSTVLFPPFSARFPLSLSAEYEQMYPTRGAPSF